MLLSARESKLSEFDKSFSCSGRILCHPRSRYCFTPWYKRREGVILGEFLGGKTNSFMRRESPLVMAPSMKKIADSAEISILINL